MFIKITIFQFSKFGAKCAETCLFFQNNYFTDDTVKGKKEKEKKGKGEKKEKKKEKKGKG